MTLPQIITDIQTKRKEHPDQTLCVMVAGGSATGKSSQIAPLLLEAFGEDVLLIEQDWYQLGLDFARRDASTYKWDDPENFQIDRLAADLQKLRQGQAIQTPNFNVIDVRSAGTRKVSPKPIIVVDGLYSLLDPLQEIADYSIYVSMPLYGRFLRRLFRFSHEQMQTSMQTPFKQALGTVLLAHQKIVRRQAQAADCVITVPYHFTDTIKYYDLKPLTTLPPTNADTIWEYETLRFATVAQPGGFTFYIVYQDRLYCSFFVQAKYAHLLSKIDFLST